LRRADGRCTGIEPSSACGFFDPKNVYSIPGEESYTIVTDGRTNINGSIRSSFGMDLVRLSAGPDLEGKSLKIVFKSASNPDFTYNIELWDQPENRPSAGGPQVSKQTSPATPVIEVGKLDVEDLSNLVLVITRTDTNEDIHQPGEYIIQVSVQ
jgi:hypothetical protein